LVAHRVLTKQTLLLQETRVFDWVSLLNREAPNLTPAERQQALSAASNFQLQSTNALPLVREYQQLLYQNPNLETSSDTVFAECPECEANIDAANKLLGTCDLNHDGSVDIEDIGIIMSALGTKVTEPDPRDADGDGTITVNDARACTLVCTKSNCAH
jgi:hypothetical protein